MSINLDEMTLSQISQMVETLQAKADAKSSGSGIDYPLGAQVVVRTFSAGVHIGRLAQVEGTTVLLKGARRLWSWQGAFTLNEVAQSGVAKGSRISATVPQIVLTQAIEIIPASLEALVTLEPTE